MTPPDQTSIVDEILEDYGRSAYWHGELKNANGVLKPELETAKASLRAALLDIVPEKQKPLNVGGEQVFPYSAGSIDGFNAARDEMIKKITEVFGE